MKKLALLAIPSLAAGLLASCADDKAEHMPDYPSGAAIKFAVTAPITPRSAETTTTTIQSFLLNAYSQNTKFMNNVTVNRTGSSWSYSPVVYWPAEPVNFYAVSPDVRATATSTSDSYAMQYENKGNVDLLYSVAHNQTQDGYGTPKPVTLNFRHALSRIKVNISSNDKNMKVYVKEVELEGIAQKGMFTFPKETTAAGGTIVGAWSNQTDIEDIDVFSVEGQGTLLTATPAEFSNQNYFFAMPQNLSPASATASSVSGSYIMVEAQIKNDQGLVLWPNAQTPAANKDGDKGIIRFPLCRDNAPMSWNPGQGYIYNITIDAIPGLDLISFNVTVDDINYDNTSMTE